MSTAQKRGYVVDRQSADRNVLMGVLKDVGYAVEAFVSAEEYLAAVSDPILHCLIADLLLPGMTGLQLCKHVIAKNPACGVVVLSHDPEIASVIEVIRAGVSDFLEKPRSSEKLLASVNEAIGLAAARYERQRAEAGAWCRFEKLTSREREVFKMVVAGLSTKAIAERCGISARTIDVHRSRILQKLHVESAVQFAHLIAILHRAPSGHIGLTTV